MKKLTQLNSILTMLRADIFGGEEENRFRWGMELMNQGMLTMPEKS